ncbi:MAG: hypothetical protein OEX19_04030 [Gammaproteobacteria bacterium]|nr:hypothetical protein [Gammaproteobacteria bacterium]
MSTVLWWAYWEALWLAGSFARSSNPIRLPPVGSKHPVVVF